MTRRLLFILFIGSLALTSCSNNPRTGANATATSVELPDSFLDFLDQFHSDEAYQKAHIQWPLQGLPTLMNGNDSMPNDGSFRWTEEEWIMHHDYDENNEEFEQTYSMVTDDIVIEQIIHINGMMGMERRFSKQDDGSWKLIYYAGMNLIRQ